MPSPIDLPTDRAESPPSRPGRALGRLDKTLRRKLPRPAYNKLRRASYGARTIARRNPGRGRVLPDYLIIGVAKGATTTVCAWLNEHPFVAPAATKEVHYFDYEYSRGEDWYRSHFPLRHEREAFAREHGARLLTGEASPTYISHRWAPERIARDLPHIKCIVVLRDPVDRAYSHYQMTCREEEEPLGSFEDAIAAEGARLAPELARVERDQRYNSWPLGCWSYLLRSRYVEQLERWFGLLSREQFHFVDNEQLATRPEEAMAAVDDFLGLPPHQGRSFASRHVASYDALDPTTRAELVEYFRPYNERLYRLIGINFGWEQPLTATASR